MEFNNDEMEMIKYALEYLHDADLKDFENEDIKTLEGLLDKFDVFYVSQLEGE